MSVSLSLSLWTAKSRRAVTGKSKLTHEIPATATDDVRDDDVSSEEDDSDYDTDLEIEQPREEYDPTGE